MMHVTMKSITCNGGSQAELVVKINHKRELLNGNPSTIMIFIQVVAHLKVTLSRGRYCKILAAVRVGCCVISQTLMPCPDYPPPF